MKAAMLANTRLLTPLSPELERVPSCASPSSTITPVGLMARDSVRTGSKFASVTPYPMLRKFLRANRLYHFLLIDTADTRGKYFNGHYQNPFANASQPFPNPILRNGF